MDSERNRQLGRLIELSREILDRATAGEWDPVTVLVSERQALVEECFATPTPDEEATEVAAAIREVLRLNQSVSDLGQQARDSLGVSIRTQRVGKSAQLAYQSNAR